MRLISWLTSTSLRNSSSLIMPRRIFSERDLGLLGENTGGELLGRHFEREEADDGAVDGLDRCRPAAARRGRPWRC